MAIRRVTILPIQRDTGMSSARMGDLFALVAPSAQPFRHARAAPAVSHSGLSGIPLLRLLQLSSALLPVGAYAYSQGLEQAVERGWVSDAKTLARWIGGVAVHSLGHLDVPLLLASHRAWSGGRGEQAKALAARVIASRESAELRLEERQLGSALARVLHSQGIEEAAEFVGADTASYVVLFALAAARWGVPAEQAAQAYLFAWAENQVAAGNRLFALGQLASQRIISDFLATIVTIVDRAQTIPAQDAGNLAPALAMASAWHEQQYCRMFRS